MHMPSGLENEWGAKSFLVFAAGTIETVIFPLGRRAGEVFCRFTIVSGSNWELVSGISTGISQAASPNGTNDDIVFNIPIECTFRTTSPFGWPKLLVCLYGKNPCSEETALGFCWSYLPTFGQTSSHSMCILKRSSLLSKFVNWISSRDTELCLEKAFEALRNNQILSMEKCGVVKISMRMLCRGIDDLDRNLQKNAHT